MNSNHEEVAKAITSLQKETLDMGDSYTALVEEAIWAAQKYKKIDDLTGLEENNDLDKRFIEAVSILLDQSSTFFDSVINSFEETSADITWQESIKYEKVLDVASSQIFKNLVILNHYAITQHSGKEVQLYLSKTVNAIKNMDLSAINIGYILSRSFFKYLDKTYFGTVTNDIYTTGFVVTDDDISVNPKYAGYGYVFKKRFNVIDAPRVSFAMLCKTIPSGVLVDVVLMKQGYINKSETSIGDVKTIKHLFAITVPFDEVKGSAKKLASILNGLAQMIFEEAPEKGYLKYDSFEQTIND